MADGFFFFLSEQIERPDDLAVIRERATPVGDRSLLTPTNILYDADATNTQPVELVSDRDRDGFKFQSFFEDYYNRIHIIPMFVDFGAVASLTSRPVVIWNAYFRTVNLTGIEVFNGDDLSVEGETLPADFLALGWKTYQIIAFEAGTVTINASISFEFDAPETVTISASGIRAKVAPIEPNWQQSLTLSYSFKTDMVETRSGKEQRRALRQTPRKTLEFTGNPRGATLREFEQVMASWQNNVVIMPEYPRYAELASEMAIGANEITLTETAPDWVVEDALVVLSYDGRYDTRNVQEVDGTTVVFTGVGYEAWPVGTKIHPGLSCRFSESVTGSLLTNTVSSIRATFDVTPVSEPSVSVPAAPETFNGRELVMVKPNWGSVPTVDFKAIRDIVDFDRGKTEVFTPVAFQSRVMTFTYLGRDFDTAEKALQFFCRMLGQAREFYMPTWEQDIIIKGTTASGSTHIRVSGTSFATAYGDSTVYKALTVFLWDGTIYHRVVDDIYAVDDLIGQDSIISVTEAFPELLDSDNVRMISWLPVWRHASDTLTVEWKTNSVAQYQMAMKMLEDLA